MITLRKTLSIALACLLIDLILPFHAVSVCAAGNPGQEQDAERVKSVVADLGADPDVHVKITLHDGTKVKGYISSIDPDSFSVTKAGTADTRRINYADVVKIEKTKGAKIPGRHSAFWPILVAIGIVIFAVVVYAKSDRGG